MMWLFLMVGWVDLRSGWIWRRTGSTVTFVWVSVGLLLVLCAGLGLVIYGYWFVKAII